MYQKGVIFQKSLNSTGFITVFYKKILTIYPLFYSTKFLTIKLTTFKKNQPKSKIQILGLYPMDRGIRRVDDLNPIPIHTMPYDQDRVSQWGFLKNLIKMRALATNRIIRKLY